jgi:3-hydroxyacyl-CoA dehydrogenase
MKLVEIIRGQQTDDETVARALTMCRPWARSPSW